MVKGETPKVYVWIETLGLLLFLFLIGLFFTALFNQWIAPVLYFPIRGLISAGISTLLVMGFPSFFYLYLVKLKNGGTIYPFIIGFQFGVFRKISLIPCIKLFFKVLLFTILVILFVQCCELFSEKIISISPHWIQDMAISQVQREGEKMNTLMIFQGGGYRLLQILTLAIIPAFVEELFMRGILQPILIKLIGKPYIAIIITSLLFSILHLSIFHFLSIFFYSIYFGYLAYSFKSIYPGVIIHFFNNIITLFFFNSSIV